MHAVEGEFEPVGYAEFVVNLAEVVLDYLLGCADLVGDFFVAHAASDAANDRQFLGRKLGLGFGVRQRRCLGTIGLNDPADGFVVDPGFAGGNFSDALDQEIGRDGARDDAADASAVEFYGVGLVGFGDLDDEFRIGRAAKELRDGVDV